MTDIRPAPLTPENCDLRGYDYMPLFGTHLFGSVTWTDSSDEERCASLRIWWSSWNQVPAASVPDSDTAQAELAGYGRDVKGWLRVKAKAFRGFILCSDGRFYHKFLAPKAVDAFEIRVKSDSKRRADRDRLKDWREKRKSGKSASRSTDETLFETRPETRAETDAETLSETHDETHFNEGIETRFQTRERKGKEESKQAAPLPPKPNGQPEPERDASTRIVRPANPAANAPREAWKHLAEELETIPGSNFGRPIVGSGYLDEVVQMICEAARYPPDFRSSWDMPIAWLKAGIKPHEIEKAVKTVANRPRYSPPSSLKYFDDAVRRGP